MVRRVDEESLLLIIHRGGTALCGSHDSYTTSRRCFCVDSDDLFIRPHQRRVDDDFILLYWYPYRYLLV